MVGRQGEKASSPEQCQGSGKKASFLKTLLQVGKERRGLRAESMALLLNFSMHSLCPSITCNIEQLKILTDNTLHVKTADRFHIS